MEWLPELVQWTLDVASAQFETTLRLALAAALGGMIGLEREASGKPAGFRTNLLICLGAALLTELSRHISVVSGSGVLRADPGRIAAQVVSGIGFLGAGTIMQSRGAVTGLTTAATLWVVAAIGMAVGAEAYIPAAVTTALVMTALRMLGRVEDHLLPRRSSERTLEVVFDAGSGMLADVQELLANARVSITRLSVERTDSALSLTLYTRASSDSYDGVVATLLARPGVQRVSLF